MLATVTFLVGDARTVAGGRWPRRPGPGCLVRATAAPTPTHRPPMVILLTTRMFLCVATYSLRPLLGVLVESNSPRQRAYDHHRAAGEEEYSLAAPRRSGPPSGAGTTTTTTRQRLLVGGGGGRQEWWSGTWWYSLRPVAGWRGGGGVVVACCFLLPTHALPHEGRRSERLRPLRTTTTVARALACAGSGKKKQYHKKEVTTARSFLGRFSSTTSSA